MRATLLALLATLVLCPPALGQQAQSPAVWQPGPDATGDNTYLGAIDAPSAGSTISSTGLVTVNGWFVDTTAQGWAGADDLQLVLGALPDGKVLGRAKIGLARADIASALGNPFWAAAGWQVAFDSSALPAGQSALSVYAHTPSKGAWSLQVNVSVAQTLSSSGEPLAPAPGLQGDVPVVTVSQPAEGEIVTTRNRSFPISGTAREATSGARGIDWVEVWLNGEAYSDAAVFLGVASLNGDGSWSLPFDPGAHRPIDSNLYVYAHSAVNGKRSLIVRHFLLANRPL